MKNEILNKVLNKIKDKKYYLCIFIVFFVFFIFMNQPFEESNALKETYNSEILIGQTDFFVTGNVITQTFTAEENDLSRIGLRTVTQDREIESKINLELKEINSKKTVYKEDIVLSDVKNDSYYYIDIGCINDSRDKEYEMIITCLESAQEKATMFALAENDGQANEVFKYNNEEFKDKKIMTVVEYYSNNVIIFNYMLWGVIFVISIIFILFELNIANEKTFLKISLIFMIFYVFIIPFPHYLDEGAHFFRAYLISQGDFYDDIDENGEIGGTVSENFGEYVFGGMSLKRMANNSLRKVDLFSNTTEFIPFKYFSSTIPTGHMIPAIGLFIGRILHFNGCFTIYLARLCTFAFYITCSYFAIKNLKYYKSMMFIMATLPIAMFVAGSISLDPIINGSVFLFISICLKYYFDEDENQYITKKDIFLIIFTAIMIITNKYLTYIPLLLAFFLIPKNKFKTKKSYITMIIVSIIIGMLCIFWQFYMLQAFPYEEDRAPGVNQVEQLKFALTHPIFVMRVILINFMGMLKFHGGIYTSKAYGLVQDLTGPAMLLGAILEKNKYNKGKKSKVLSIVFCSIFSITLLIALLALYLSYTAVGDHIVGGYQLRYNVPILLFLLIPVANLFRNSNEIDEYETKVTFYMFILNLDAMLAILIETFTSV